MKLSELSFLLGYDVKCFDYVFDADPVGSELYKQTYGFLVWATYMEPDVTSNDKTPVKQTTRSWFIPHNSTRTQVVQTCFKLVLTSMEHRAREAFTYKGKRVLSPHMQVDNVFETMKEEK